MTIDMTDRRLIDPASLNANDGTGGRLRRGAPLLRSPQFVSAVRDGRQFRIPATDDWRNPHAMCACGKPVEWNCEGLDWPVCDDCMTGAVSCLADLAGDAA